MKGINFFLNDEYQVSYKTAYTSHANPNLMLVIANQGILKFFIEEKKLPQEIWIEMLRLLFNLPTNTIIVELLNCLTAKNLQIREEQRFDDTPLSLNALTFRE